MNWLLANRIMSLIVIAIYLPPEQIKHDTMHSYACLAQSFHVDASDYNLIEELFNDCMV